MVVGFAQLQKVARCCLHETFWTFLGKELLKEPGKPSDEIYSRHSHSSKPKILCHFLLDMTVGFMKEVQSINVTQCHYKQSDKLWALIRRKGIA